MLDLVIGLGSNLGDRWANLHEATCRIANIFRVIGRSAVYESAPVGPEQPDYLNAAVRILTVVTPGLPGDRSSELGTPRPRRDPVVRLREVLHELQIIEARGGRVRPPETRWGPRTIDLDLLWGDGLVVSTPELTLPHPHLTERAFAMRPLLDVAPAAIDPRTGAALVAPPDSADVRLTSWLL